MDPGPIFYILFTTPAAILCLLFLATPTVFHTLLLTLCSARPKRLTTSLFRVGQSSGLFLCRFHVVEGTTVNQARVLFWRLGRSHHQQPFDRSSSPTGTIKPWIDYSRETCCCLHHKLPLGVNQLVAIKLFFWRRCRGFWRLLERGVS